MRKLRIYLDTPVISYLFVEDASEKKNATLELWSSILNGEYDVIISETTIREINDCSEPKRQMMINKIKSINALIVYETEEIITLANKYIEDKVLSKKSRDDCLHIASAIVAKCDLIISWNFKHLVRDKTILMVNAVSKMNDIKEINIVSPSMLIERGE